MQGIVYTGNGEQKIQSEQWGHPRMQCQKPRQPQAGGQREESGLPKHRRWNYLAKTIIIRRAKGTEEKQLLLKMVSAIKWE